VTLPLVFDEGKYKGKSFCVKSLLCTIGDYFLRFKMNDEIRTKLKDIDNRLLHMWRYL